jgi:hypothetical protein
VHFRAACPYRREGTDIGLPQEPVGSFPEFVENAPFQQGLDLVLAGVERLGGFLQCAEHSVHFHHSRLITTNTRSLPGRSFGDLISRL